MSKVTKKLGIAILGLVLLGTGGALALRVALTPDRIHKEVVAATERATGLPVSLRAGQLSWLPLGFTLDELRIAATPAGDPKSGPAFLEFERGLVRLKLTPLLLRRVVIDRIELDGPQLTLTQTASGVTLPGKLGEPPAPSARGNAAVEAAGKVAGKAADVAAGQFETSIRRVEIRNGVLRLAAEVPEESVELTGIDMFGRLDLSPRGERIRTEGELSLASLELPALEAYRATLDRLAPKLEFTALYVAPAGEVQFEQLRLAADPLDLQLAGSVTGLNDTPEIDFALAPQTYELQELLPLVPSALIPEGQTPRGRGPVEIAASVRGPLDGSTPLDVRTQLRFENAEFAIEGYSVGLRELRGGVRTSADEILFEDLSLRLGDGTLRLDGEIRQPGTDTATMDFGVTGDLDLGLLEQAGLAPEGVRMAGRLDVDLRAKGAAADPAAAELSGHARLDGATYSGADLALPVSDLAGEFELAGADVNIRSLTGALGRSRFDAQGVLRNAIGAPQLELDGSCAVLDLVEWSAAMDGAIDGAPRGESDPSRDGAKSSPAAATLAAAAETVPLIPVLPPIPTDLALEIDSLLTVGNAMTNVTLDAQLRVEEGDVQATIGRSQMEAIRLDNFRADLRLADRTMSGAFRAPEVLAHVIPLTNVTGQVALDAANQLRVTDVTGEVWSGTVTGRADVDLSDPELPSFDIRSEATNVAANQLVSTLTPANNLLHGTLDLKSRFQGEGATAEEILTVLTGEGQVDTREGRIEGAEAIKRTWKALGLSSRENFPFRDLAAPFRFEGGRILTENLLVKGRDANLRVNGSAGLDRQLDYTVTAELSQVLADEVRAKAGRDLAKLLEGSRGEIIIDLRITGDADSPQVELDRTKLAARVAENLKQQLGDELKKGAQDLLDGVLGGSADSTTKDAIGGVLDLFKKKK